MFLDDCEQYFNTNDLYEVLQVAKTATASQIKKAYYSLSMRCHPDKMNSDEKVDESARQEATARFQIICKIYGILSDKKKRAVYDETGAIDEENVMADEETIKQWRTVFKKVTLEDIEKFCAEFKGSDQETKDVEASYTKWDGDMGKIMGDVIGVTYEDEERIKGIIDNLIKQGSIKATKKYKSSTSKAKSDTRKRKANAEAKEAEEEMAKINKKEGGSGDLMALIAKRQADRATSMDSFYDSLAAKYAPTKKTKKQK